MASFKTFTADAYRHVDLSKDRQLELHNFFEHNGPFVKAASKKIINRAFGVPFSFKWGPYSEEKTSYKDMTESRMNTQQHDSKERYPTKAGGKRRPVSSGAKTASKLKEIKELLAILDWEYERDRVLYDSSGKRKGGGSGLKDGQYSVRDRVKQAKNLKAKSLLAGYFEEGDGARLEDQAGQRYKYEALYGNKYLITGEDFKDEAKDKAKRSSVFPGPRLDDAGEKNGVSSVKSAKQKTKGKDKKRGMKESEESGALPDHLQKSSIMDEVLKQLDFDDELDMQQRANFAIVTSEDTPHDLPWMKEFMRTATQWKYMFGMVPYFADKSDAGHRKLFIPDVSSGHFVAFLDTTAQIQCYWKFDGEGEETFLRPNANVYIFPECSPFIHLPKNPFNSVVGSLMDDWYTLQNTKENTLIADYLRAHAPLPYVDTEELPSFDNMSSQDMFKRLMGSSAPIGAQRVEDKRAKVYEQTQLMRLREQLYGNMEQKKAMINSIQTSMDSKTFELRDRNFGMTWQKLLLPLGHNIVPHRISLPEAPKTLLQLKEEFLSRVEIAFSVTLRPGSSTSVKTVKGIQTFHEDQTMAENQIREEAAACLEECFTIALGKFEDNSVNNSIDKLKGKMSNEYQMMKYYETFYGKGHSNPYYGDYSATKEAMREIEDAVRQKAWEVHNMGMKDGIYTDQNALRAYIKQSMVSHINKIYTMNEKKKLALQALAMKIRLTVKFHLHFSEEAMNRAIIAYDKGLITKEAASYIVKVGSNFAEDIPTTDSREEALLKTRFKLELQMEKEKHKLAMEREKQRFTVANKAQAAMTAPSTTTSTGLPSPSAVQPNIKGGALPEPTTSKKKGEEENKKGSSEKALSKRKTTALSTSSIGGEKRQRVNNKPTIRK